MRRIELYGNQKQMETVTHRKIKGINKVLREAYKRLDNWENETDERYLRRGKEKYEKDIADLEEERTYYVKKLYQIRKGYIYE